jgi:hypothetical protein
MKDWKSASVGAPWTRILAPLKVSSAVWQAEQFIPAHGSLSPCEAFQRSRVALRFLLHNRLCNESNDVSPPKHGARENKNYGPVLQGNQMPGFG